MEPMAKTNISLSGEAAQEGAAVQRRSRSSRKPLDPDTADAFVRRLCHLLDTEDFFGKYASFTPQAKIAKQFLASAEDKSKSEFNCAVSPEVRHQVPLVFQAIMRCGGRKKRRYRTEHRRD